MGASGRNPDSPSSQQRSGLSSHIVSPGGQPLWGWLTHQLSRRTAALGLVNAPAHQCLNDPGYFHLSTLPSKIFWIVLTDCSPDGPKKTALRNTFRKTDFRNNTQTPNPKASSADFLLRSTGQNGTPHPSLNKSFVGTDPSNTLAFQPGAWTLTPGKGDGLDFPRGLE